jgi:addiction module HigA family antidote
METRKRAPTHPGGIILRHYLEPLNLTVSEASTALGVSRKTLSKVVNERGAVTPDMALRLARAFQTTPEMWLNLQRNYDLWHAAHDSKAWQNTKILKAAC